MWRPALNSLFAFISRHQGDKIPEGAPLPPCDICAEAEAWAQGMMDTAPKFGDSLRKHFQSTLPLRSRAPLPTSMQTTPISTLKKNNVDTKQGNNAHLDSF